MEKFHSFLAHTYVTMGQVSGKTLLPLPPADVTSNDTRTSNKEKAHILESKSHHPADIWCSRDHPLAEANQKRAEAGP
jgi:hypothetical protein